ncbi:L-aspartate oxidase [Prochlorococcus sp. MIT 1341]|uniref:L-aspartate oxidase n=1 Tax=Prochlorococcus sp. MIT 1341 TaxID=3096221 RepID=UPI002A758AB8|nr:L-aspartate oxidase [Prochlorococcus sp. MIT 1341]
MLSAQPNSIPCEHWDVVVVGAGAAGLMTCLELPRNLKVLLLNRNTSSRSSSRWAQGGISAVTRPEDSIESHAEDTLKAGRGLCDIDAVNLLVKEAPNCVKRLQKLGMVFDHDQQGLSTTLEAAHSFKRVLHVKDRTGRALIDVLRDRVEERANLFHKRGVRVTQLWVENNRCCGVQVLEGEMLHWIAARAVVLATGGGGHLFANTTNPAQACGEGLVLAWEANASIEDLEFIQFHPTALKLEGAPCFLITEALRGEGAVLVDSYGKSPVADLEQHDLAPRDQVSRALFNSMQEQNIDYVELNLRNIPPKIIANRFPTILSRCREFGIDPLKKPIPVAPAAHYWMGGVATNLNAETSLPGLYAVGEVACTGLHGANRLASNSLMECLVFARQLSSIELPPFRKTLSQKPITKNINPKKDLYFNANTDWLIKSITNLRRLCWEKAGVSREEKSMKKALDIIETEINQLKNQAALDFLREQEKDVHTILDENSRRNLNLLLDLRNRQKASFLLLKASLFRKESRGGHFRTDSPKALPQWQCHSSQKKGKIITTRPLRD